MNLPQEIDNRIQRFVAELNELVRKQALEAVASALGTAGSSGAATRRATPKTNGAAAPAAARAPKVRGRRKGEKRSAAELAQLEASLVAYVTSNPGQGIEAIGQGLQLPTTELTRPMKKLVLRGAVTTQGAKRATKYFPGSGDAGAASAEDAPKGRGRAAGKRRAKKR